MDQTELFLRIRMGSVSNVRFADFTTLVEAFGFELERISGSHHIFRHAASRSRLNVQPLRGDAKPYQVRQFLRLVELHGITWTHGDD